jgi:hypothetical protein
MFMRVFLADMVRGHQGRNPPLLMPKMESDSDMPGGHDLVYCCGHLGGFTAEAGVRWPGLAIRSMVWIVVSGRTMFMRLLMGI